MPGVAASHSEYVTGQVPAGGPVRISASPDVCSETTRRGVSPGSDTDERAGPSSTGCRPTCSIAFTACSSSPAAAAADAADAADDEPDDAPTTSSAAGCPQSPRTTGANVTAVAESTNRTLADCPMAAHSAEAAGSEPPYVAEPPAPRSRTRLTSFDKLDEYCPTDDFAASPGFSVVTSGGIASASTQQAPTSPTAAREAPTTEARDVSRDDIHNASSRSPGSTTGTSRCDATGCQGTTAGSHRTVATDPPMIRNGSPHSRDAAPDGTGCSDSSARTDRRPRSTAPAQASSTAGTPRYQKTQ